MLIPKTFITRERQRNGCVTVIKSVEKMLPVVTISREHMQRGRNWSEPVQMLQLKVSTFKKISGDQWQI